MRVVAREMWAEERRGKGRGRSTGTRTEPSVSVVYSVGVGDDGRIARIASDGVHAVDSDDGAVVCVVVAPYSHAIEAEKARVRKPLCVGREPRWVLDPRPVWQCP